MAMNVEAVLETVLASSVSAGIVAYLSKSLLTLWLNKDFEAYRTKLATASASEIEQLRGQLERVTIEHEVRFKRMHEKRTEVIATIFAHLEELHASLRQWGHLHSILSDKTAVAADFKQRATTASNKLAAYFYPRAIWLERDLCDSLNDLLNLLGTVLVVLEADAKGTPLEIEGAGRTPQEMINNLLRTIGETRAVLEERFRKILGLDDAKA